MRTKMAQVTISFDDGSSYTISLADEAKEAIRYSFNPSGLASVNVLKALAASYLSAIKEAEGQKPEAGREFAVAKTNMQTASMWAILGATKGL
jgi:hypothetical protein